MKYINSSEFTSLYGSHYIIPKRLNQDIVESFFSLQRQACGGSNNMTAYTYGYNVNSRISFSDAKLISRKQTNVNQIDTIDLQGKMQESHSLPKRNNVQSIFTSNMWSVHLD